MSFLDCIHHTSSTLMQNINVSRCGYVIENNQIFHNVQLKDSKPTLDVPDSCLRIRDIQGNISNYMEKLNYSIIAPLNNMEKNSSLTSIKQIFGNLFVFFVRLYETEVEHKLFNPNTKYEMIKDFCKYICFISYDKHEDHQYHLVFLYRHLLLNTESIKKNKIDRLTKNVLYINEVLHYLIFRKTNQLANQITPCSKNCKLKKYELYLINLNVDLLHNIYCTIEPKTNKLASNTIICRKYSKLFSPTSTDLLVNRILM